MEEENKLHKWEKKHRELCFVNKQKNLPVFNMKTLKDDFIRSGVRLYQADDVNKIIKEAQKELLENWLQEMNTKLQDKNTSERDKRLYILLFGQLRKKQKEISIN